VFKFNEQLWYVYLHRDGLWIGSLQEFGVKIETINFSTHDCS
jgi:hypothetical protein